MADIQYETLQHILVSALFIIAVVTDLTTEKIPNLIVILGLITGISFNGFYDGLAGFGTSLLGALTALLSLVWFYKKRIIGAGDIKLMMAIGSFVGPAMVFWSLCLGIAAGGVTTLAIALYRVGWQGIKMTAERYYQCLITRTYFKPSLNEAAGLKVPYAPALAIGWFILITVPIKFPGLN
ncbi:A24 family peptidase [Ferrimonas aestuarii]|uniref:Prepilin peptidase n=1 Tax=Ferrimonas aestuarii TaxID=2569539 RepID=A0A4V5NWJ7_9GAMM|nr:A24 family peptidase [Ferrimonas aestuarii]TKB58428.1 prepilin peptidase [Ferrimonas aestuarii]